LIIFSRRISLFEKQSTALLLASIGFEGDEMNLWRRDAVAGVAL
jgi:hypothetical protein